MLDIYVAGGGHPSATADRGRLPAGVRALRWHRIWAAHWLLEQCLRATRHSVQLNDIAGVRRQLNGAERLLNDRSGH